VEFLDSNINRVESCVMWLLSVEVLKSSLHYVLQQLGISCRNNFEGS
jgi:hypothetical protein